MVRDFLRRGGLSALLGIVMGFSLVTVDSTSPVAIFCFSLCVCVCLLHCEVKGSHGRARGEY